MPKSIPSAPPPGKPGLAAFLTSELARPSTTAPPPPLVTVPTSTAGPPLPSLADEPDLIAAVRRDLELAGLVGESDAGLLVWLAYTSRVLPRPLSVIVRGPTGSGKDEVQRRPADLIPDECKVDAMGITPAALAYQGDELVHKVLLGGERSHQDDEAQRDRTQVIRQLLSHGYYRRMGVSTGRQAVTLEVRGPVAYSETTTKESVFAEDENRCLQVFTDPGEALTRRVMVATASRYADAGASHDDVRRLVRERHHEFQRGVVAREVYIPFNRYLAESIPARGQGVRRMFGHLLSLVEVVTLVHQSRREVTASGRLVATAADYAVARQLIMVTVRHLASQAAVGGDEKKLRETLPGPTFSTAEAEVALAVQHSKVATDRLRKMAAAGILEQVSKGRSHCPAVWRWRTAEEMDAVMLPLPENLL